jgi:dihydroorotase
MNRLSCDLVLSDVKLLDGRVVDLSIRDGRVCHAGSPLVSDQTISCQGRTVIPAAVDMHVHMRGGIQREKEDWETGSMSAIAGGVTVVVDQPNTLPPLITPEAFRARVAEASRESKCGFAVNAGVMPRTDLTALWRQGAMAFGEIFTVQSSYGEGLSQEDLSRALREIGTIGGLATIHAEEVTPGVPDDLTSHNMIRSSSGETKTVQTLVLSNGSENRLHFCHLSTADSIAAAGKSTVEVTPHHLFLSIEQSIDNDPLRKVNPPLRHEWERKKLWSIWDRIDVIASDHAPHTIREKNVLFGSAPSGIPGVETMVPLLFTEYLNGRIQLLSLVEKTSWRPAEILGIPRAGFLPGERADFTVFGGTPIPISADDLKSRAGWTPFEGFPAVFPDLVIMRGIPVYWEGEFLETSPHWYPGRGYNP